MGVQVAPGHGAAFYGSMGPPHVMFLNRQGEIAAAIGQQIVPVVEPAERPNGRRAITLPKGVAHAAAPVKCEAAYRLKIAFTRGAEGSPARAEISIAGGAPLLTLGSADELALSPSSIHRR